MNIGTVRYVKTFFTGTVRNFTSYSISRFPYADEPYEEAAK